MNIEYAHPGTRGTPGLIHGLSFSLMFLINLASSERFVRIEVCHNAVAALGGVPGVLAPLGQAPRTIKIDLYK